MNEKTKNAAKKAAVERVLPVGEPDNTAEDTVNEFKKQRRAPTREDHIKLATSTLAEVRQKMAEGFVYETPEGVLLDSPEKVMQRALAHKPYVTSKPEPEKKSTTSPEHVEKKE